MPYAFAFSVALILFVIEFLEVQIARFPDKDQCHHCDRGIDAIDDEHPVPIVHGILTDQSRQKQAAQSCRP